MKKDEQKKECVLTNMVKENLEIVNRHITVLKTLQRKQPTGIAELSKLSGYPRHKVRYSLKILEQEGLIEPSAKGAVTTEDVDRIIKRIRNTILDVNSAYDDLLKRLE